MQDSGNKIQQQQDLPKVHLKGIENQWAARGIDRLYLFSYCLFVFQNL